MQTIPTDILKHFSAVLEKRAVPATSHADYRKWLRYYIDFRSRYTLPDARSEHVRMFVQKLQEKGQTSEQQNQAAHALSLFFESQPKSTLPHCHATPIPTLTLPLKGRKIISSSPLKEVMFPVRDGAKERDCSSEVKEEGTVQRSGRRFNEWRCLEKSGSPDWDKIIDDLAAEIKTRHYSRKTLKAYADWSRKFQSYLKNKPAESLASADVKAYLTYLAVNCKVAASTQNQAFNALLFLYRNILKQDFGLHKDIPRAKKSSYIPVVLSRQEIDAVLAHLKHPYNLAVRVLYGCGLRLFECVNLRVKDFNFDAGILTVRGKGNKSRTVPIPQKIVPELTAQLGTVKKLHDDDIASGYSGVFLEDQLEKKYPRAVKELIWQWFFPQSSLTVTAVTKERRRYHLHEKNIQEALYEAVRLAKLTKRVTCHTFRHSFATHLLQANYDIRTIQELLGHSDVKTTMIYTHCVPSRTVKEAKSPLDF